MDQEDGFARVPADVCPECGSAGTLVREVRDMPFEYRAHRTTIKAVHGVFCSVCGEGFSDPEHPQDWQRLASKTAAFMKQVNELEGERLRQRRMRLKLTQAEAGRLFGGGVSAFSEYERGHTQPHRSTVLLLELLSRHPELMEEIKPLAVGAAEKPHKFRGGTAAGRSPAVKPLRPMARRHPARQLKETA